MSCADWREHTTSLRPNTTTHPLVNPPTRHLSVAPPPPLKQKHVPFEDFHPPATRAAGLSFAKPKVIKTFALKFDSVGGDLDDDSSELLSAAWDDVFVGIARRFVDAEIKLRFAPNHAAIASVPTFVSGLRELIDREFERLYRGKIKEALHTIRQETIKLSLQRIRDAQRAGVWA